MRFPDKLLGVFDFAHVALFSLPLDHFRGSSTDYTVVGHMSTDRWVSEREKR